MDRNKALDKITKCLRLSKSSNAHEAAAALRQAQKLMAQYQVTEAELTGATVAEALAGFKERRRKTTPMYAQMLVGLIRRALGVTAVFTSRETTRHDRLAVRYFGPEGRVKMAIHAHSVVSRAMHQAWMEHKEKTQDDDRLAFYLGWLQSVAAAIQEYGISEEEQAAIDSKLMTTYGKSLSKATSQNRKIRLDTAEAGRAAGSKFKLHRPVDGSTNHKYLTQE